MIKIETTLENAKEDMRRFYKPKQHHFIVMNAVDLGGQLEVQWFFCDYNHAENITTFYMNIPPTVEIPTICSFVPSAWVAEAELSDLMDINIENTARGFVLDPDSEAGPLRKKK